MEANTRRRVRIGQALAELRDTFSILQILLYLLDYFHEDFASEQMLITDSMPNDPRDKSEPAQGGFDLAVWKPLQDTQHLSDERFEEYSKDLRDLAEHLDLNPILDVCIRPEDRQPLEEATAPKLREHPTRWDYRVAQSEQLRDLVKIFQEMSQDMELARAIRNALQYEVGRSLELKRPLISSPESHEWYQTEVLDYAREIECELFLDPFHCNLEKAVQVTTEDLKSRARKYALVKNPTGYPLKLSSMAESFDFSNTEISVGDFKYTIQIPPWKLIDLHAAASLEQAILKYQTLGQEWMDSMRHITFLLWDKEKPYPWWPQFLKSAIRGLVFEMIERDVSSMNARRETFHRYEYKHDYTAREDIALLVRQLLGVSESPMDWTHFDRSTDHSIEWEEEGLLVKRRTVLWIIFHAICRWKVSRLESWCSERQAHK